MLRRNKTFEPGVSKGVELDSIREHVRGEGVYGIEFVRVYMSRTREMVMVEKKGARELIGSFIK
jgi:hypothetical protein